MRNLAGTLRLDDVAASAQFSPCHFHRVFKAFAGETLNEFVKRQRLERALYLMSHAPTRSLSAVALDCGFASSSDFSRSFKRHYGQSPRAFDLEAHRRARRAQFDGVMAQAGMPARVTTVAAGDNPDGFAARLRDLPARTVAYIRVPDPYRDGVAQAACDRLVAWADARGLADGQWLGYMWEEPEVVALADCYYNVAVVVADDVAPTGEIGRYDFSPMRVAEVTLRGDIALEARAIDWLYKTWLPHSGYEPDDQPAFEAWIGRPFAHGNTHFEIACQLPVKRVGR